MQGALTLGYLTLSCLLTGLGALPSERHDKNLKDHVELAIVPVDPSIVADERDLRPVNALVQVVRCKDEITLIKDNVVKHYTYPINGEELQQTDFSAQPEATAITSENITSTTDELSSTTENNSQLTTEDVSQVSTQESSLSEESDIEGQAQTVKVPDVDENDYFSQVTTENAPAEAATVEDDTLEGEAPIVEDEEEKYDDELSGNDDEWHEEEPAEKKDYAGYRVYRVTIPTEAAAAWIMKLDDLPGIEFWADPKLLLRPVQNDSPFVTSATDIMVAPDVKTHIEDVFKNARLPYSVLIDDVQKFISKENPPLPENWHALSIRNGHFLSWDHYHSYEDIDSYLEFINKEYPNFVQVSTIGYSSEGRAIKAVRLHQDSGVANKKTILIDAGIHAREWITPATVTYMINEIIEYPSKYECIMEQFDWVFIPLLNPDGYSYTHTKNRMWRKTRSKPSSIIFRKLAQAKLRADRLRSFDEDPILDDDILERFKSLIKDNKASLSCIGVDANRNFDFQWVGGGSSRNPCSETFRGPAPNSESEVQALTKYILDNKDDIAMYISMHAYSQMWLIPWGYTTDRPQDYSDLYSLAKIGGKALEKVHNTSYLIGTIPDLLYIASGSSIDWAKGVAGIKYTYTLELRDAGRHGFLLPAKQIIPTGDETWAAMYAVARELSSRIYDNSASCPTLEEQKEEKRRVTS